MPEEVVVLRGISVQVASRVIDNGLVFEIGDQKPIFRRERLTVFL